MTCPVCRSRVSSSAGVCASCGCPLPEGWEHEQDHDEADTQEGD